MMDTEKDLILGIDTSNYRTSVALVDLEGSIVYNYRELLKVPEGERGLRQSEAFFQHVNRLPGPIADVMEYRERIRGISVSTRPRPRDGSYMPCFLAGHVLAKELSSAMDLPLLEVSHQEGHVEAVKYYSELRDKENVIFFHFSGGTTEAIFRGEIVGGTKDISYGQVLDRIGVKLCYAFPAGEALDSIALEAGTVTDLLTPIKVNDAYINLSGIEAQAMRTLDDTDFDLEHTTGLIREVFDRLADSIIKMSRQLSDKYGTKGLIFSGGVASSEYIKDKIQRELGNEYTLVFGPPELSGDNACGTALLMLKHIRGEA